AETPVWDVPALLVDGVVAEGAVLPGPVDLGSQHRHLGGRRGPAAIDRGLLPALYLVRDVGDPAFVKEHRQSRFVHRVLSILHSAFFMGVLTGRLLSCSPSIQKAADAARPRPNKKGRSPRAAFCVSCAPARGTLSPYPAALRGRVCAII